MGCSGRFAPKPPSCCRTGSRFCGLRGSWAGQSLEGWRARTCCESSRRWQPVEGTLSSSWVQRANPGLQVAGTYAPPFVHEFSAEQSRRIVQHVNAAHPDVLWVGFGAPKQEGWIHHNLARLHVKVAIGVGAAFELASDTIPRAPRWMQESGLEWFFRFLKEPRRLFKRYFVEAAPFLPLVVAQKLGQRAENRD
jgi:UDP-N-acetyl-D-mannosaminuronic acid transferase (WecB/TagA/CpsF family)